MKINHKLSFHEAWLYVCYMNYHATGEGVRSCISIAGSVQRAEQIMKEKLPEYFYIGIVTYPINEGAGEDVEFFDAVAHAAARSSRHSRSGPNTACAQASNSPKPSPIGSGRPRKARR